MFKERYDRYIQCDACMFYVRSGSCVMMEPARSTPLGSCPAPYTTYEKLSTGCASECPSTKNVNEITVRNRRTFRLWFDISFLHFKYFSSVYSPPPVDVCYTPGPCSRASDIRAAPITRAKPPCGTAPVGQRRTVLEYGISGFEKA